MRLLSPDSVHGGQTSESHPDLEEPPAPSATPVEEITQASALKVTEVPEQPPVSVQKLASATE